MKNRNIQAAALACAFFLATSARADERLFGYVYQADVLPKGAMEFEQWITNRNGKAEGIYSRFDLQQELEFGVTDNLTTALYLRSKSEYQSIADPLGGPDITTEESAFEGVSNEWKYRLQSPETSWLGAVAYGEVVYNGPELEVELKLILQHNIGEAMVAAVNLMAENEYVFEASRQSVEGKLELTGGLAYRLTPAYSLGAEVVHRRVWPDNWGFEEASAWFAGPALHGAWEKVWATLTVLPQLSGRPETNSGDGRNLDGFERVETRLVAGVDF